MTLQQALVGTDNSASAKAALDYLNITEPKWGDIKLCAAKHNTRASAVCDRLRRWGIKRRLRKPIL